MAWSSRNPNALCDRPSANRAYLVPYLVRISSVPRPYLVHTSHLVLTPRLLPPRRCVEPLRQRHRHLRLPPPLAERGLGAAYLAAALQRLLRQRERVIIVIVMRIIIVAYDE